jgi:hypothetical protein
MSSISFGYFLNNLLSFGFNTPKKISLFLHVFLTFRDLQDVKWTQTFCHIIYSGNRKL